MKQKKCKICDSPCDGSWGDVCSRECAITETYKDEEEKIRVSSPKRNHTTRNLRQAKSLGMRELDKLWAELVKKRDGDKCAQNSTACFGRLDAHHIVTRKNMSTRYLLENGITLCRLHHSNAENFTRSFNGWFDENFNERWGKVQAASRVLSKTGAAYLEKWSEYLNNKKEKLGR